MLLATRMNVQPASRKPLAPTSIHSHSYSRAFTPLSILHHACDLAASSLVQPPPAGAKVYRGLEGVFHFSFLIFIKNPHRQTQRTTAATHSKNKREDAHNNGAAAGDRTAGAGGRPRRHHFASRGSAGALFLEILQQQQQPSRSVIVVVSNA